MATFQIFNADCLQKMKDISSNSIDLILCDLPYGCLEPSRKRSEEYVKKVKNAGVGQSRCSWDIPIDLEAFWKEVKRIRKNDNTPTIHFCTTKFGIDLINSNPKEFRYDLVWTKTNAVGFLAANKMPMRAHEMMYVFSKAGAYYSRIDISGNFAASGGGRSTSNFIPIADMPNIHPNNEGKRCVKSYIEVANKKTKGGHPTAKPIDLYKWLIERYCPPGGTVLDPTFGSCNSGKAARELKRNYIGIEKDKDFFDKAK
jgi:DNA modification methylase